MSVNTSVSTFLNGEIVSKYMKIATLEPGIGFVEIKKW